MDSKRKIALLIFGLLAMLLFISSEVAARELKEVTGAGLSGGRGVNFGGFGGIGGGPGFRFGFNNGFPLFFPGFPSFRGFPGFPGFSGGPGFPGTGFPGTGFPGTSLALVVASAAASQTLALVVLVALVASQEDFRKGC
eukprot:XP_006596611.2 keratin, type II cytoskeletal 2 epidermal-like [Glycine max]